MSVRCSSSSTRDLQRLKRVEKAHGHAKVTENCSGRVLAKLQGSPPFRTASKVRRSCSCSAVQQLSRWLQSLFVLRHRLQERSWL